MAEKWIVGLNTNLPMVGSGCLEFFSFSEAQSFCEGLISGAGGTIRQTITNFRNGTVPSKKVWYYCAPQTFSICMLPIIGTQIQAGLVQYNERYLMQITSGSKTMDMFRYASTVNITNTAQSSSYLGWDCLVTDENAYSYGTTNISGDFTYRSASIVPVIIRDSGHTYIGGLYINTSTDTTTLPLSPSMQMVVTSIDVFNMDVETTDPPSPETEPVMPTDGVTNGYTNPSHDDTSDTVDVPNLPTIGFANSGVGHIYKMNSQQLHRLVSDIFPKYEVTATDALDLIAESLEFIYKSFDNANLINFVIDCHALPINVPSEATPTNIDVGHKTLSATGYLVNSDYVEVNLGTLSFEEYYANFLDYADTEVQLFLPFIGFVPIQPEYLYGTLTIIYQFNIITGDCMAFVKATSKHSNLTDSVVGQYRGSCITHIPIQGLNYANMVSTNISSSLDVLSRGDIGSLGELISSSPTYQKSNGYSSSANNLSIKTPFLLIGRGVSQYSANYRHEHGLPVNLTYKLEEVHGYTVCDIHELISTACEEEKQEIINLLNSGVYLP